jgi:hypothetical protein
LKITGTSSAFIYDCVCLDSAWAEKSFRGNKYAHSMLDAFFPPQNCAVSEMIARNNTRAGRAKENYLHLHLHLLWCDNNLLMQYSCCYIPILCIIIFLIYWLYWGIWNLECRCEYTYKLYMTYCWYVVAATKYFGRWRFQEVCWW